MVESVKFNEFFEIMDELTCKPGMSTHDMIGPPKSQDMKDKSQDMKDNNSSERFIKYLRMLADGSVKIAQFVCPENKS